MLREDVPSAGEETPTGHDDCQALETESNSAVVAELYLALESLLPRHGDAQRKRIVDPHACAESGAKWQQEIVPGFSYLSLLEAVWRTTSEVRGQRWNYVPKPGWHY